MDDHLLAEIERARRAGAIVLLKWDGERTSEIGTVLVSHPATGWLFRRDTDAPLASLQEGLRAFWAQQKSHGG